MILKGSLTLPPTIEFLTELEQFISGPPILMSDFGGIAKNVRNLPWREFLFGNERECSLVGVFIMYPICFISQQEAKKTPEFLYIYEAKNVLLTRHWKLCTRQIIIMKTGTR